MRLDEELRTAYQEETKEWSVPAGIKHKMLDGIRSDIHIRRNRKRWLVTGLLAVVLIIPTGAYAGYTYLADGIYGSQENITAMGGTAEDYMRLEAKLQTAKTHFSEEEFVQYMDLLKKMGQMAVKYADSQGKMHPEQWGTVEQEQYNLLVAELEPFFEKLEAVSTASQKDPMNEQQFWTEQLARAEEMLSKEEYTEFKSVYEQMKEYELMVVDKDGSIHDERLSVEQKDDLRQLRERLIPYLEKLGLDVR
ncbi:MULTISPECIES: DUF3600 domain-containing protein [unclassified Paenibacillus]|uniref:DUF3600 domain-containing protein n=1 Tax=unclassified Paenibacillus TaxID=185978 RepID=UPI000CFAE96F|nr:MULTISPECIES: DUF3600 domain-containing protein [unclassified Paenibacillus]PRA02280.1 DUF3600 domain-containing protein [Paenibacillus sp. MYb63]PRA45156.1 DUF3600 domain-containing protein [Paenibacillus sp. MYb67]QZN76165.1 DUF3600 domain-containing protein [Paenibacillus sp. DR312]